MSDTVVLVEEVTSTVDVLDESGTTVVEVVAETIEVVEVVAEGPQGAQGPVGPVGPTGPPVQPYMHTQSVAAATWVIEHNFGRGVHVTLLDDSGEHVEADIVASSSNVTTVTFPSPVTGTAVIS